MEVLIYDLKTQPTINKTTPNEQIVKEDISIALKEDKDVQEENKTEDKTTEEEVKEVAVTQEVKPIEKALSAKAEKTLNKIENFNGQTMTRKEFIQKAKEEGYEIIAIDVKDETATRKIEAEQEKLSKKIIPGVSNPNLPDSKKYFENKKKLEEGIFKKEYRVNMSDGTFQTITKTEYDYANTLKTENKQIEEKTEIPSQFKGKPQY